jgi:hypothetical protein
MLPLRVTWAFLARSLPSTAAPAARSIESMAMIVPAKLVEAARVAELPTTQNTFLGCALFIKLTMLPAAVIRVVSAWNMKTALLSPPPSSVRVPVSPKVPARELYTPGGRVVPPNSGATVAVVVRVDASL